MKGIKKLLISTGSSTVVGKEERNLQYAKTKYNGKLVYTFRFFKFLQLLPNILRIVVVLDGITR